MIPLFKVYSAPGAARGMADALASGYIGEGPRVKQFETRIRKILGLPTTPLAVNSGTSALELAYHLAGIESPDDEVITTPMTCSATNIPLARRNASIRWADVDPMTGNIDPLSISRLTTEKTRAIVVVDWGGRPQDWQALRTVAFTPYRAGRPQQPLPIIEDAAHAFGAPTGGDYVCWSFQAIKHLTTGDGGALQVPEEQYDRARLLRWYGLDHDDGESFRCSQDITEAGYKYHLNDLAAALGLENAEEVQFRLRKHREHAAYYQRLLAEFTHTGFQLPPPDPTSAWWLYTLLVGNRDEFMAFMTEREIMTSQVHRRNDEYTVFQDGWAKQDGELPGLEHFSAREVCIPVGWWLEQKDLAHIVAACTAWAKRSVSW